MADLVVVAASVLKVSGNPAHGIAGETITAGQAVYLDSSTTPQTYKKALNNGTVDQANSAGIALNGAAPNQPLDVLGIGGVINPGVAVALGETYAVSATAGGICPIADVGTGGTKWVTILGVATTIANITLNINPSGVKRA